MRKYFYILQVECRFSNSTLVLYGSRIQPLLSVSTRFKLTRPGPSPANSLAAQLWGHKGL